MEKDRDKGKQKVRFDDGEVSARMLGFGGIAWRTVASGQIKDGEATSLFVVDDWDGNVLTDVELLKEQNLEPTGVNPTPHQRVEVYWPEYREYFRGSMGTRVLEDGRMKCEYDDWDYEITDMKQRLWRAGSQPMEAPKHTELERL